MGEEYTSGTCLHANVNENGALRCLISANYWRQSRRKDRNFIHLYQVRFMYESVSTNLRACFTHTLHFFDVFLLFIFDVPREYTIVHCILLVRARQIELTSLPCI